MNAFDVLSLVWPAVMLVLSALLVPAAKKWLETKIANEEWEGAAKRLTDAAFKAASVVGQTYVDEIKAGAADGKLTSEEKREAMRRAKAAAKSILGEDGYDLTKWVIAGGDESTADGMIEAAIEHAVRATKNP